MTDAERQRIEDQFFAMQRETVLRRAHELLANLESTAKTLRLAIDAGDLSRIAWQAAHLAPDVAAMATQLHEVEHFRAGLKAH